MSTRATSGRSRAAARPLLGAAGRRRSARPSAGARAAAGSPTGRRRGRRRRGRRAGRAQSSSTGTSEPHPPAVLAGGAELDQPVVRSASSVQEPAPARCRRARARPPSFSTSSSKASGGARRPGRHRPGLGVAVGVAQRLDQDRLRQRLEVGGHLDARRPLDLQLRAALGPPLQQLGHRGLRLRAPAAPAAGRGRSGAGSGPPAARPRSGPAPRPSAGARSRAPGRRRRAAG